MFPLQPLPTKEVSILLCFLFGGDLHCLPAAPAGLGSTDLQHDHLSHSIWGLRKDEKGITWCLFLSSPCRDYNLDCCLVWLRVGWEQGSSDTFFTTISKHNLALSDFLSDVLQVHKEEQPSELETGHQLHMIYDPTTKNNWHPKSM